MNCKQIETILNKLTVSKNGKILGKSRIIDELHSLHLRTIEVNKISSNVPVISSVCKHKWQYWLGSPQNETHRCVKCGAVG